MEKKKLDIRRVIKIALIEIYTHRLALIKKLTPIVVAFAGVLYVHMNGVFYDVENSVSTSILGSLILSLLPIALTGILFVYFAVICHRTLLIGEHATPHFGFYFLARREWRYMRFAVCLSLVLIALGVLCHSLIEKVFGALPTDMLSVYSETSLSFITAYFVSRLSMVFPAVSVEKQASFLWAWNLTKGNSLRIFFILVLVPYGATYLLSLFPLHYVVVAVLVYTLTVFVFLFEVVALTCIYRELEVNDDGESSTNMEF